MFNLKLFVPVLALAAMALPAGASTLAVYCVTGCQAGTITDFQTAVTGDTWASASDITFGSTLGVLSGGEYTDDLTGVTFQAAHSLSDSTGALDTKTGDGDTLTITVPAAYSVVLLNLVSTNGTAGFFLESQDNNNTNLSSTPVAVGYVNSAVSGAWTIQISDISGSESVGVTSFDVAGAQSGGGPGNGETPEVATFILIGSGLLAMRWMRRLQKRSFRSPQAAC